MLVCRTSKITGCHPRRRITNNQIGVLAGDSSVDRLVSNFYFMNLEEIQNQIEGGKNMRDIAELHASELGEIIWQNRSGASAEYISKRLRVKLWQIERYVQSVEVRIDSANDKRSDGGTPFTPAPCSTFPEGIEETWRADAAEQGIVELQRENEKLRGCLLFIRDECDWETPRGDFRGGGDERIGPAIDRALRTTNSSAMTPKQTSELPTDVRRRHSLERVVRALLRYINRTPELLSLLYDLDLLPEQLKRDSFQWRQMLILANWHHKTRRHRPNAEVRGREPSASKPGGAQ